MSKMREVKGILPSGGFVSLGSQEMTNKEVAKFSENLSHAYRANKGEATFRVRSHVYLLSAFIGVQIIPPVTYE